VNNVRSYYNIIRWLTENEVDPESEEETEETEPELIAAVAEQNAIFAATQKTL
jgi:hypothetical protein